MAIDRNQSATKLPELLEGDADDEGAEEENEGHEVHVEPVLAARPHQFPGLPQALRLVQVVVRARHGNSSRIGIIFMFRKKEFNYV